MSQPTQSGSTPAQGATPPRQRRTAAAGAPVAAAPAAAPAPNPAATTHVAPPPPPAATPATTPACQKPKQASSPVKVIATITGSIAILAILGTGLWLGVMYGKNFLEERQQALEDKKAERQLERELLRLERQQALENEADERQAANKVVEVEVAAKADEIDRIRVPHPNDTTMWTRLGETRDLVYTGGNGETPLPVRAKVLELPQPGLPISQVQALGEIAAPPDHKFIVCRGWIKD